MKTVSLKELNDVLENANVIRSQIKENRLYHDGKITDKFESVAMDCLTENIGKLTIVYPYTIGLADKLCKNYPFAKPFKIAELGEIRDVKISIYKENLLIKVFMY